MGFLSGFDGGWDFQILSELYSEFFENKKIDENEFLEVFEKMLDEELEKEKPRKRRGKYEGDKDDEEDEGKEEYLKDYAEAFKREIVDYLLAAKLKNEGQETIKAEYRFHENGEYGTEPMYSNELKPEVTNLKYENPVFFNRQWTYQRVFIENKGREETVYSLTVKAMDSSGVEVETKHDKKFDTGYMTSMDGRQDGEMDNETGQRKYWEYWIIDKDTGEERIGEEGIHEQKVKKNEMVEWRLATEQESGCGGGISYDPESLMNDPTINKLYLPSFMQNYISNFRSQIRSPMTFRQGQALL
ncbi:MAG: hypothetical protein KAT94_01510 [Candidatus Aenigmarchaeota archaeon]|nr:hypothetical protein [Candidatus Aenigmarchaeota archaeon]